MCYAAKSVITGRTHTVSKKSKLRGSDSSVFVRHPDPEPSQTLYWMLCSL